MNYFVVGTNDMDTSKSFHNALFAQSGLQTMSPTERMTYRLGVGFAFAAAIFFDQRPMVSVHWLASTRETMNRSKECTHWLSNSVELAKANRDSVDQSSPPRLENWMVTS